MRISRVLHLLLTIILSGIVVIGCEPKESPPAIHDGAYLEYTNEMSGMMGKDSFSIRYNFSRAGENRIHVNMDVAKGERQEKMDKVLFLDNYLRDDQGERLNILKFADIWIPPGELEVGNDTKVGRIAEHKPYKKWRAAVINASMAGVKGFYYYELKTGFLLRVKATHMGAGWKTELTDTNFPELKPNGP